MSCTVRPVTPRKLHTQSLYLEPERAELLDRLAAETRIPKAVLLREAVDDLLAKYKLLKGPKRKS
jgi:predicted DNA-binding protein